MPWPRALRPGHLGDTVQGAIKERTCAVPGPWQPGLGEKVLTTGPAWAWRGHWAVLLQLVTWLGEAGSFFFCGSISHLTCFSADGETLQLDPDGFRGAFEGSSGKAGSELGRLWVVSRDSKVTIYWAEQHSDVVEVLQTVSTADTCFLDAPGRWFGGTLRASGVSVSGCPVTFRVCVACLQGKRPQEGG